MNKLKIILLVLSILSNCINSQSISENRKNQILSEIYDTTAISVSIIYDIADYGLTEFLPLLDKYYHKQALKNKVAMIETFSELNFYKAKQYALTLFDSIKALPQNEFWEEYYFQELKGLAIALMNLNDFTMAEYIIEKGNKFKPWNDAAYRMILRRMVKNPIYQDWAKNEYKRLTKDLNWESRTWAVEALYEFFGMEAYPYLIDMMRNDPIADARLNLIDELGTINNKETIGFLMERMFADSEPAIRIGISELLLEQYPSPTMYNKMYEYAEFETDTLYGKAAKMFDYFFKISKPDSSISISVMLDSLNSYTEQCYGFNWIDNDQFKNELTQKLQAAGNYLNSSDSLNCYKQIKSFQTSIQQVYQDSAGSYPKYVSKDAYKFLYYYPQYILERLPSPPKINSSDSNKNNSPLSEPMDNQRSHFMRKEEK